MQTEEYTLHKEMGISHNDFFRLLPIAIHPRQFKLDKKQIRITDGDQNVLIRYSQEKKRKIASITLPITELELIFTGFSEKELEVFMTRFDRTYQRGGG